MAEKTKKAEQPAKPDLPPPNARTLARAVEAKGRNKARHTRVSVDVTLIGDKKVSINPPHDDVHAWEDTLHDAFGTTSRDFVSVETRRLIESQCDRGQVTVSPEVLNASLAVVDGARPENEIAAMLAAQLAVTHSLAMVMLGRTRRAETVDHMNAYGALATKLVRASTGLTEALVKLRRGGEQTVRVEHVHVHSGGQAIVGPVTHQGGGASPKIQDQPHAQQIAYAPVAPLRGEVEAERAEVPVASGSGS